MSDAMCDFLARWVMRYHTCPWTPIWTKHTRLYRRIWNWAFSVRASAFVERR